MAPAITATRVVLLHGGGARRPQAATAARHRCCWRTTAAAAPGRVCAGTEDDEAYFRPTTSERRRVTYVRSETSCGSSSRWFDDQSCREPLPRSCQMAIWTLAAAKTIVAAMPVMEVMRQSMFVAFAGRPSAAQQNCSSTAWNASQRTTQFQENLREMKALHQRKPKMVKLLPPWR